MSVPMVEYRKFKKLQEENTHLRSMLRKKDMGVEVQYLEEINRQSDLYRSELNSLSSQIRDLRHALNHLADVVDGVPPEMKRALWSRAKPLMEAISHAYGKVGRTAPKEWQK